jgi:thiamine-phosphate pyrophosphorylase
MSPREALSPRNLRPVDASLNRLAEGLRYLEDVARFLLDDAALTDRLKSLRHRLVASDLAFQKALLDSRAASDDVGVGLVVPETQRPVDLYTSVVAGARRAQEAVRSLEESSRVIALPASLSASRLEKARFELYTIEKDLVGRLLRKDKASRLHGVYVVLDTGALRGRSHTDVARQALRAGAAAIQLRDKTLDRGLLLPVALELQDLCRDSGALFFVNDYVDLALAVRADGVHVGQTDLPVTAVRRMVPIGMLVGCSAENEAQARKAQAEGADYVGLGPVFATPSKVVQRTIGVNAVQRVKKAVSVPVVAIGGISLENVRQVRDAGADAVAVISAVLGAPSPEKAVRQLSERFEGKDGKTTDRKPGRNRR